MTDKREDDENNNDGGLSGAVLSRSQVATKRPSMYKVILHNDNYTPMEFVVDILQSVFKKNHVEAHEIMLAVQQKGIGICGIFPYEVAETKVAQVSDAARDAQHPLKCTLERA